MQDRRLVAGRLLGSFVGTEAPAWLLDSVRDGLGGVLLFAQNVVDDAQVSKLCGELRAARDGVIIAIDEEGGDVTRLDAPRGSDTPCPAAFGYVDDPRLTTEAYTALGRRIHGLGIDLTLAPCADINSNPLNPIIGVRSFGATADVVSRHVTAAVDGFHRGGVAVCVKHFPGHGDTSADTHVGPARIEAPRSMLSTRELAPFRAAVEAGVDAVMTAHLIADAVSDEPASLSARWHEVLRDEVRFDGVVITDALDMDAVALGRGVDGVAAAAVRALQAGADLLCIGPNFSKSMTATVIETVLAAVDAGAIDRARLELSAKRIRTLRATPRDEISTSGDAAARVAAAAIQIDGPLPAAPFAVLECRPRLSMASFNVAWGIAGAARERGWAVHCIDESDDVDSTCATFAQRAGDMPLLVVMRDSAIHPWQLEVGERCAALRPDTVVVEFGSPSAARPDCRAYVVTHGAARASAVALVDRLSNSEPAGHIFRGSV